MKSVANNLIFESPYQAFPMNNAKMFFHAMHYLRTYHARWRLGYYASAILLVLNPFFPPQYRLVFVQVPFVML